MIVVFPYSHEQLELSRLPFATIAIIALCIIVYFPVSARLEAEQIRRDEAYELMNKFRANSKCLKLPDELVSKMSADLRTIYHKRQEWLAWYRESPKEVNEFLNDWVRTAGRGPSDISGPLEDLAKDLASMRGINAVQARKDVGKGLRSAAVSSEAKASFLLHVKGIGQAKLDETQKQFDNLYDQYRKTVESSSLNKFAFIPARPSLLGVIAHQFMHADLFHLIINLLFLWVAAVKLEDLWSRPIFIATFLFCGIAGALTHRAVNPLSTIPLMGASGAVAGLMGASLIRLSSSKIQYFYAYWFFSSPKVGTFRAPAFVMLSIWLLVALISTAYFGAEASALWSQIGGFAVGLVIAVVFKLIRFERTVLGREPKTHADPRRAPLVAFKYNEPKPSAQRQARARPAQRKAPLEVGPEAGPKQQVIDEPKEEDFKDSLFMPNISDIDLPTDEGAQPEQPELDFEDIELPPLEELDQSAALPGLNFLELPTEDQPESDDTEPEKDKPDLKKADTSMLDQLAEEAFKADADQGDSPEPSPNKPSEMPLPYLPTMVASGSEEAQDEHIELPSPVSLSILEGRHFSAKPIQMTIREVELKKIRESMLSVDMYGSGSLEIPAEEIRYIAIGRIEKIDEQTSAKFFTSGTTPRVPALVLTVIKNKVSGKERDVILGYMVDDSKTRYEKLMRSTFATRLRNFIALTKIMLRFYKNAEYLPGPGPVGENNLPLYRDTDEFFGHIEEYLQHKTF